MIDELLLFQSSGGTPKLIDIVIWTAAILIVSQLLFLAITRLVGIKDINDKLDSEKKVEYKKWKDKGISSAKLLFTELLNSGVYAPVVEELVFRVVLLKYLLVDVMHLNPQLANVLQGILFGSLHLTNSSFSSQTSTYTNYQSISATISGIVSGWVYIHTNSIWPSLFAHIINNCIATFTEWNGYVNYLSSSS